MLSGGRDEKKTVNKKGSEGALHGISIDVSCEDVRYHEGPHSWLL